MRSNVSYYASLRWVILTIHFFFWNVIVASVTVTVSGVGSHHAPSSFGSWSGQPRGWPAHATKCKVLPRAKVSSRSQLQDPIMPCLHRPTDSPKNGRKFQAITSITRMFLANSPPATAVSGHRTTTYRLHSQRATYLGGHRISPPPSEPRRHRCCTCLSRSIGPG